MLGDAATVRMPLADITILPTTARLLLLLTWTERQESFIINVLL